MSENGEGDGCGCIVIVILLIWILVRCGKILEILEASP